MRGENGASFTRHCQNLTKLCENTLIFPRKHYEDFMMSSDDPSFVDIDDPSTVESPKTSKTRQKHQKPDSPSPKSNINRSTRKCRRGFLFEAITEENEPQINERRKSSRLSNRTNKPSTSGEKSSKTRQIPSILITSPSISPRRTRARAKLKLHEYSDDSRLEESEDLDESPAISPIRPRFKENYDYSYYSNDSHLEESEELDISSQKCSSTPIPKRNKSLKKKIAIKNVKSRSRLTNIDETGSSSDSADDFAPIKPKRRPKAVPKRKKAPPGRDVEFSPIRKCPDDFVEHSAENPMYYLKDNIKSYDASKSAERRFLEAKRINELRNVEIPPKRRGKMKKDEVKINNWARKLNEEFSDIEKNYELLVETT